MRKCLLFLACLITCCTYPNQDRRLQLNQVVIIFDNAPAQSMTDRCGGIARGPESTLTFVDTLLRRIFYVPRTIGYDTLVVPASYGYAEVFHRNQALEEMPYLLQAGDTVLFTYESTLRPQMRSLISDDNTRLYNLLWSDPRAVHPNGYSTSAILTNDRYILADRTLKDKNTQFSDEIIKACRKYHIDLDSLRPLYEAFRNDLSAKLDSFASDGVIPPVYVQYYKRLLSGNRALMELSACSDSLLSYISNWNLIYSYFSRKAVTARSTDCFDEIARDTALPVLAKNAYLHEQMFRIQAGDFWRPYPAEVVERYRVRYRELTGDSTSFFPVTVNKENLLPEGYSNDLILEGLDGEQVAFEQVLHKHRGKVIYVDLWASWCAPCRGGMPAAKRLREAYKGRDVVFLYLAVNDTSPAWRSAVKSCQTDYLGENYRVLNGDDSRFLREIKHTKIPHMLLYDRTGKLVDTDAPRPEEEQLKNEIFELLNPGQDGGTENPKKSR